jgi:hypothetical protein
MKIVSPELVAAMMVLHLETSSLTPTRDAVLDDNSVMLKPLSQFGTKTMAALRLPFFHKSIAVCRFQDVKPIGEAHIAIAAFTHLGISKVRVSEMATSLGISVAYKARAQSVPLNRL